MERTSAQPMSSRNLPRNLVRDARTVASMVRIACEARHGTTRDALCSDCRRLLDYAELRLAKCPYGRHKTTCRECPIHCYRPAERAAMKDVMVFAGPRMLWRHPLQAIRHVWIERQGPPRRRATTPRP